jgi:hypothetical protein
MASSTEIGGGISLSFDEMPYHSAPFLFDDMLLFESFWCWRVDSPLVVFAAQDLQIVSGAPSHLSSEAM